MIAWPSYSSGMLWILLAYLLLALFSPAIRRAPAVLLARFSHALVLLACPAPNVARGLVPGRKAAALMPAKRLFTPEEDRRMQALQATGATQKAIAQQFRVASATLGKRLLELRGGLKQTTISERSAAARAKEALLAPPKTPQDAGGRKCLRCGRMFWSKGAQHRLCPSCKKSINDHGAGMDA